MILIETDYLQNRVVIKTIDEAYFAIMPIIFNRVESITATDDELKYIFNKFINIPKIPTAKQFTWYGDYAKIIVKNLLD